VNNCLRVSSIAAAMLSKSNQFLYEEFGSKWLITPPSMKLLKKHLFVTSHNEKLPHLPYAQNFLPLPPLFPFHSFLLWWRIFFSLYRCQINWKKPRQLPVLLCVRFSHLNLYIFSCVCLFGSSLITTSMSLITLTASMHVSITCVAAIASHSWCPPPEYVWCFLVV